MMAGILVLPTLYLWALKGGMMEPCEERIVVALERAGVDVALNSATGIVTVADAVRAIEHIAACWREEAGRAITRGRDAKRWEAKARQLEKDLAAAKVTVDDLTSQLGARTRQLETTRDEATAKIDEQGAKIAEQSATIERLKMELDLLHSRLRTDRRRR
jgi:uncharacterized coiled-coil protein SlyX